MQRWTNFFRGSVTLRVEGDFPERFLNLCASHGVEFWGIMWQGEHCLSLEINHSALSRAKEIGIQVMCLVEEETSHGVPAILIRVRKRYAFLVGLACSMIAVCILSQFIITIEVEGNELVSTEEIIWTLRRQGLSIFSYGPSMDERQVANQVLLEMSGISWMSINIQGTQAQVLVREATQPPEVVDQSILGDVVSRADGIILRMEVEGGDSLVSQGSTVLEGETLISGWVRLEAPEYSGYEDQWYQVRAGGQVYARTWRTLEGQISLEGAEKAYTGEQIYQWYLNFFGYRVNFYGNGGISFTKYDKINETWTLTLPWGDTLPIAIGVDTIRQYETQAVTINQGAAQTMIEESLRDTLASIMGADGTVEWVEFTSNVEEDTLVVVLTAECQEEIGLFVPWFAEEES